MEKDIVERLREGLTIELGSDVENTLLDDAANEIDRLREKCDKQAAVLKRLTPEKYPGVLFIHGHLGNVDDNGLPDKLLIVPAYGCDWSQVYVKGEQILGGMGS